MPLHHSPPGRRPQTLAVGLLLLLSGASQAETWVITDKAHPVSATGSSRVLLLDAQQH
ncbi:TIGR03757 family integrating conjugative element protein, partial [Pseudomonas paraeruginosa]